MLKGGAKIWHKTKYPLSLASSNNTMHAKVTEGEKKQCNKETDVILKQLQKRKGRQTVQQGEWRDRRTICRNDGF